MEDYLLTQQNNDWKITEVKDAKMYNKLTGEFIGEWPELVEELNKHLKETGEFGWSKEYLEHTTE